MTFPPPTITLVEMKAENLHKAVEKIGTKGFGCDFKPAGKNRKIVLADSEKVKKAHNSVVEEYKGVFEILAK